MLHDLFFLKCICAIEGISRAVKFYRNKLQIQAHDVAILRPQFCLNLGTEKV